MNSWPLVSIITVNYNQAQVTLEMIASLRHLSYPNVEIIVVDNASRPEEPNVIGILPGIKLLCAEKNLGFAGGNNLGIKEAEGEYLFFLNNDTEVDPGALEPLVTLFTQQAKAGIASPKILYHESGEQIQYAGSKGMNPWTGRSVTIGALERDSGQYDAVYKTPIIDGAAMMVPARVVREVGLMPEIYFLYYEELDWCEIIKRNGYESFYVGTAKVYHKESMSVGKSSLVKTYYMNRNRLLYIRRNLKGWQFITSCFVFLCMALPKRALQFALKGQWRHVGKLYGGLVWNLTHGPAEKQRD